jgi:hypothetical protein
MPPHRRGDADTEAFRGLPASRAFVNCLNNARAQIRRIGPGHGSLKQANHPPRLRPSEPLGNPDSITLETALNNATFMLTESWGDDCTEVKHKPATSVIYNFIFGFFGQLWYTCVIFLELMLLFFANYNY